MIGSLMYLTSSRPDIMFAFCACARFQVTPKASHLHAVKRIFRYLKGKPHLGLWYPKDSPFDLVAYSDSNYAGASLDQKSTTRGCQFLGCRLISWQCKKQKVMATSSTEAEYVAADSCYAQVLWIQNQLLDYGPDQTVSGKDSSNLLMADNFPKIVWYSTHHVALMKSWLVQKQTALGVNTPRSDDDRIELIVLMIFLLPKVEKVRVETIVAIKKVNDITRLQALVDKKKKVVTEATIRDALRLDDAEGVECLLDEEIFTELARMGYEKPSTKLTFYKAFFSSQKYVGDLSTHTTMYISPAMTQKVFANMRRVGKGFSRVKTPLFKRMVVEQQVAEGDADEVHGEDVNAAGVVTEGVVSAADDVVPTADEEPSIPSLLHHLHHHNHLMISLPLPKVEHLEHDKVAQALEITKLKSRVKKLERRNKASKLKRLKKIGSAQRIDTSDDTVMDDDVAVEKSVDAKDGQVADVEDNADIQGRTAESQAEIYKIDMDHANKVLSMQEEELEPIKLQEVMNIVTTAKIITKVVTATSTTITAADVPIPTTTTAAAPTLTAAPSRRTKGVVIRDPKESTTTSIIIHSEAKSKGKGTGILVKEPKPLKKQAQIEQDEKYSRELEAELNRNIDWDEVIDHVQRNQKEDKSVKRYQALKRKPQTEAQARKNMMTKDQMDEEDSRALKRLNESKEEMAAKKQKLDKEVKKLKRHLQIIPNDEDDVYTEATPLARKVPVVDYEIYNENNKPYYKIKRADGSHQLYLSFLSLLRNFDREDLEALWSLVKERFATAKPKNFSNDFLMITLGAMFEKPAYRGEPSIDLLRALLNLGPAGNWLILFNKSGPRVLKAITKPILHIQEIDFRSFMTKGMEGMDDVVDEARNQKLGKSSKATRKRKLITKSSVRKTRQKARKVPSQVSKAFEFPSTKELKDSTDCHWVVAHMTPPSWKQQLKNIRLEKLYDIYDKAYTAREKDKAYANLEMRCNDALQDIEKNSLMLVLEEKKWVSYEQTLSILRSKVKEVAPLEVLLSKKLKSLCLKHAPSSFKPSSFKAPNPTSLRTPCRRYFDLPNGRISSRTSFASREKVVESNLLKASAFLFWPTNGAMHSASLFVISNSNLRVVASSELSSPNSISHLSTRLDFSGLARIYLMGLSVNTQIEEEIAFTFEGLALIPCLVMRYPMKGPSSMLKEHFFGFPYLVMRCPMKGPSSMPKEHSFGLSFMLMAQSLSKFS
uniref:Uncharacterized mitochondrial protein AtMg00810-like n=1 Tax=Tanacetum cinerariifolium TaxID=118510 RepID=A0A6L2KPH3_TANCI|nr:uncharacterized mitochondrial protein AtMg00810-like [Tanacetum cinerariifolium]